MEKVYYIYGLLRTDVWELAGTTGYQKEPPTSTQCREAWAATHGDHIDMPRHWMTFPAGGVNLIY